MTLTATKAVDGLLAGSHRSPRRGASVVFVEHRHYRPGDDPRLLDHRAFARTDRDVVKRFEQETELTATIVIDASSSMAFAGSEGDSKYLTGASLALALGYVMQHQGDSVGLLRFDESLTHQLPARNRPGHLKQVLEVLATAPQAGRGSRFDVAIEQLRSRRLRRGILFVISDLLFGADSLRALSTFTARGFDVRVLQVLTGEEIDFPYQDAALFIDKEVGKKVEADPASVGAAYRREFGAFLDQCQRTVAELGAQYQLIRTDRPIEEALLNLTSRPKARNRRRL